MSIRKSWTREEELELYKAHKNFKRGQIKDKKFVELSRQFGRTTEATSRHYYHMLKHKVFDRLDVEQTSQVVVQTPKTTPSTESVFTNYQVFWTKQRLDVLKNEIKKRFKEQYTYKKMIHRLMQKFSFSSSTIENKLRDLQNEIGIHDLEQLAEKIEQGQVKSTMKSRVYRKNNKKVMFTSHEEQEKQVSSVQVAQVPIKEEVQVAQVPTKEEELQVASNEMVSEVVAQTEDKHEPKTQETPQQKQSLFSVLKNAYLNYKISKMEKKIAQLKNQIQ